MHSLSPAPLFLPPVCLPGTAHSVQRRRRGVGLLIALATLAGLASTPALAAVEQAFVDSRAYTGAQCTSDGPTSLSAEGERENLSNIPSGGSSNSFQMYQCPIVLPGYHSDANGARLLLEVRSRQGSNPNKMLCRIAIGGSTPGLAEEVFDSPSVTVNLPAVQASPWNVMPARYTAHLRCRVYNLPSGGTTRASLISYTVTVY